MSSDVPIDDKLYTMKLAGTARRIVKAGTDTFYIWIPVYIDSDHKYHRALPNFLLPYKHYKLDTIKMAIRNDPDIDLFDLPCDSTIMRWKSKMSSLFDLEISLLSWHLPHSHHLSSFVQMTLPFHTSLMGSYDCPRRKLYVTII